MKTAVVRKQVFFGEVASGHVKRSAGGAPDRQRAFPGGRPRGPDAAPEASRRSGTGRTSPQVRQARRIEVPKAGDRVGRQAQHRVVRKGAVHAVARKGGGWSKGVASTRSQGRGAQNEAVALQERARKEEKVV